MAEALDRLATGEIDRLMIMTAPRHGKLLSDDTPVLTTKGWTTHGELVPGDRLYHPDGGTTAVLAVGNRGTATLRVTFTGGETIDCHPEHEWQTYNPNVSAERRRVSVMEAQEIRANGWMPGGRARYLLPEVAPLRGFDDAPLPIAPYPLGAWLGDGTAGKAAITYAETVVGVIHRMAQYGYEPSVIHTHPDTRVKTASFAIGAAKGRKSRMRAELEKAGCFREKHIPTAYKTALIADRIELLAGLIDTDGHVEPETGRVRIVTVSERLALDIFDVAASLAFRPYITTQEPSTSTSGIVGKRRVYTVGFQPTMTIPCALERKISCVQALRRMRSFQSIEEIPAKLGHCIHVDAPDGMYLVGRSLIPTHNSTMGSEHFPASFIGQNPRSSIVAVSSTTTLASEFGLTVRNIVKSDTFGKVFPEVTLMKDAQARGRWRTRQGGGYLSLGVGGAIMGRGADVMLIDDPYKSYEDAQNKATRQTVQNWYLNTALNRMEPGGRIAIINHRMAADDLCGMLLERMRDGTGDKWEVIELPAESNGEALWPERFPLTALHRLKQNMNPLAYSALFMQNPAPADGQFYKSRWIQRYKRGKNLPPLRIFGASDFAVTEVDTVGKKDPDYTEHGVFGLDCDHNIYVLAWWHGQTGPDEWIRELVSLLAQWEPVIWGGESGTIRNAVQANIYREMQQDGVFTRFEWMPSLTDKVSRSTAIQGRFANLKVFIPETEWGDRLVQQMLVFPSGKHDDACDVLSLAGRLLPFVAPPADESLNEPSKIRQRGAEQLKAAAAKRPGLNDLWKDARKATQRSGIYAE